MKTKNLIIGGGFSGLYLASILSDATLIEKSGDLGGLIKSIKSDSEEFIFDIGGHVYTTRDETLTSLLTEVDAKFFPERKAYFNFENKVPYPIQYHEEELGIKAEVNSLTEYDSFGRLLCHEFGQEMYKKVLLPFNSRVWSTLPSLMDTDWVTGRVALMKDKEANWGSNSSFFYAPGYKIIDALLERGNGTKLLTDCFASIIDYDNKVVKCVTSGSSDGKQFEIEYENLFDTTGICLDHFSSKNLPINYVVTIGIGLSKMISEDFHWWYNGTDNASPIHRITLLSRYYEGLAPKGKDSLLVEIPVSDFGDDKVFAFIKQSLYGERGIEKVKDMTMDFLEDAEFDLIGKNDIQEVRVITSKGYPIPVIGHRNVVSAARFTASTKNVYLVGRWGAHGYYNLDHLIKDAEAAIRSSLHPYDNDLLAAYAMAKYYYKTKET